MKKKKNTYERPWLVYKASRLRVALFCLVAPVILIAGLLVTFPQGSKLFNPVNPGTLSAKHASLSGEAGCLACHRVHTAKMGGWLKALSSKADLSQPCLDCHDLGGPASGPHNRVFADRPDLAGTACLDCHTEHRGASFNMQALKDSQCQTCHINKFKSFSEGHPPFSDNFPYRNQASIEFDHAAHFNEHFKNPKFADKASLTCTACHLVESLTGRFPRMTSFEKACVSCHAAKIPEKDFLFFRLPEIPGWPPDAETLGKLCGPVPLQDKKIPGGVPLEKPAIASGVLLNVDVDDPASYGDAMKKWIEMMAQGDLEGISELVKKHPAASDHAPEMLAGLTPELLKQAACSWLAGPVYSSSLDAAPGTWFVDWFELLYKPKGHADPVAKAWIEFTLRASSQLKEKTEEGRLEELRKRILSQSRGVGECMKCHTVNIREDTAEGIKKWGIEWKSRDPEPRALTPHFLHATHLKALGAQSCAFCHGMRDDASSSRGDFRGMPKETCLQCHGAHSEKIVKGPVPGDCLLCHTYHNAPTLKKQAD